MKTKIIVMMLMAAACITVSAQIRPRWVGQKGVRTLNSERSNKSYNFYIFDTFGADINLLKAERFLPLIEHVGKEYGTGVDKIQLDSLRFDGDSRTTYRLSFQSQDGKIAEVFAQLVDDWSQFENDVDMCGFELHQLYAVSAYNVKPQFDNFSLTTNYGLKPLGLSIIPGLGQIYKGQPVKGYAILGAEALFIGGAVYTALEMGHYDRMANRNPVFYDSYQSKATYYRQMRNICFVAGGALYIYNLIDAAFAKGARRVVIKHQDNKNTEFALTPVVCEDGGIGVGMFVRF